MTITAQVEAQNTHAAMVEFIAGKITVEQVENLKAELSHARYNLKRPALNVEWAFAEAIYGEVKR